MLASSSRVNNLILNVSLINNLIFGLYIVSLQIKEKITDGIICARI